MRVLIIADDLTGALDSCAPLAGAGLRCVLARRPGDVPAALRRRPDVLTVSTASREGGAAAAQAAVALALEAVGQLPEIVFKKIDSRLKGHVAHEVAVVAERIGCGRALVAPAVPAQGRFVLGGRLTGDGVPAPVDVAALFAASGLAIDAPDACCDADLDAILAHALDGPPTLLVGAAGLAAAVARRIATGQAPAPRLAAPILFAIGSRDPITLAQVARLARRGEVVVEPAPDGVCPELVATGAARLLRLAPGEGRAFDARAAGDRFAEGIARIVRGGGFGSLFACGGETADAILGALDHGVLDVEGELSPGVPVSTLPEAGRRLRFVTKSGGFGDEDALVALVAAAGADWRGGAG